MQKYHDEPKQYKGYLKSALDKVAQRLNSRPRKTLGYATPADRLANTLLH